MRRLKERRSEIVTPAKGTKEIMEIFLIDGIGPFFRQYTKRQINWSKVPFINFSQNQKKCNQQFEKIAKDLEKFAKRVSRVGYNSISLDDVAHLTIDKWLEPEVNKQAEKYREHYHKLFTICRRHGLDVYLTMDILSLTPGLQEKIGKSSRKAGQYLQRQISSILDVFPEVKGLILRIGECDGKDVRGIFKSELILKTPRQVNRLIHRILPVFESKDRNLILRSWTVGAYKVGDLIWHRRTMSRVLKGIDSDNFILSLKYGESDFFRYLPLNSHFFRLKVKKIIELQARREYEGCGEYPSFIGWDYQKYANELKSAENMAGISVWCQTGGWVPFRRLSYIDKEGLWNELNSYLCIKIFKEQMGVEEAIYEFAELRGYINYHQFVEFLELNDQVIKELLYIDELAEQKLFFRRVRIPPLISVFWNNIFINHSVRKIHGLLVVSGEECVKKGYEALEKISAMKAIADEIGLPVEDIEYMYDTFSIFALAREYYFLPYNKEIEWRIARAKKNYKKKYPKKSRPRYRIKTNFSPFTVRSNHLKWMFQISLRKKRGYRVIDYLITLHFLGALFQLLVTIRPQLLPKFAREKAMGIETIFK